MERRKLLKYSVGGVAAVAAGGLVWAYRRLNSNTPVDYELPDLRPANASLTPTPACGKDTAVTPNQVEGPFYTPDTPQRTSLLESGIVGEPLVLEGLVTDVDCRPIPGAVLDFWSCDGEGVYDNDGFRLRGHQFTDADGRYRLKTIKPSAYSDGFARRTPHIHVKAQGPNTTLLTTQLYFPGEELNEGDGIFDEALLVSNVPAGEGQVARFDFVLA